MMKIFFSFLYVYIFLVPLVYAASSDVTIRFQMGIDSTPPSTPSSLVALPISSSQIDLFWGASTDNSLLGGYQVFRNFLQIATTTLTTYSDSGLIASTSYTYYIKAFDDSFNISSSSNIMTTSTSPFAATSTATTTENHGGFVARPELVSFSIEPSLHAVKMSWATSRYVQFELRWGRTASYELGFVTNELYKKDHSTSIDDLESGTTYEFQIIAYDKDGRRTILKEGQFKTLDAQDTSAPTNVSNLHATASSNDVLLTWDNPQDDDFSHVRIVRSYLFYPNDPADGFIAYEGGGTSLRDTDAFISNKTQYYTIFSYDAMGNISSGAVVSVHADGVLETVDIKPSVGTSTDLQLLFTDFELVQNNIVVAKDDLDVFVPLTIRIAYEKLPEHLKTITVTFTHPNDTNSTFSFLLRINKDKTFYEASIAPLRTQGSYPVTVAIFDHQTQKLFSLQDTLYAHKKTSGNSNLIQEEASVFSLVLKICALLVTVVTLWILIFYRVLRKVTKVTK